MGHTDPSPTPVHIRSLRSIYRVSCGLHHSAAIDGEEDFSLHNFFFYLDELKLFVSGYVALFPVLPTPAFVFQP